MLKYVHDAIRTENLGFGGVEQLDNKGLAGIKGTLKRAAEKIS